MHTFVFCVSIQTHDVKQKMDKAIKAQKSVSLVDTKENSPIHDAQDYCYLTGCASMSNSKVPSTSHSRI